MYISAASKGNFNNSRFENMHLKDYMQFRNDLHWVHIQPLHTHTRVWGHLEMIVFERKAPP